MSMAKSNSFWILKSLKKGTFCDKKKTKKIALFLSYLANIMTAKKVQDGTKDIFCPNTNLELAMLGLNLLTIEKMNRKDAFKKQMLIHLTEDEFKQIQDACKQASLTQFDYLRHKLLSTSIIGFIAPNDIHNVRLLGFMLIKIFKELDDLEQVKYEVEQIKQVVQEVKMLVRKLNDEFEKR